MYNLSPARLLKHQNATLILAILGECICYIKYAISCVSRYDERFKIPEDDPDGRIFEILKS